MPDQESNRLRQLFRDYLEKDLRQAYLIICAMVIVGAAVNLLFDHGWTIWPFIAIAGILLMVHEAADRNGQGVPPLHVYAFFAGAISLWLITVILLSAINPFVLFVGIGGLLYYGISGYIKQREHDRLIAHRRENRLCIYCGEPADPEAVFCPNCGEEPNPDVATMRRVAAIVRSPDRVARARANLTPAPPTAGVAAREAALLKRHPRARQGK